MKYSHSDKKLSFSFLRGAVTLAVTALIYVVITSTAGAHGSLEEPPSRTYACRFLELGNPMCAQAWDTEPQALYDWMEVNIGDAAGNHQQIIPDGELCSAGRDKYAAFDEPGDWSASALVPNSEGVYTVDFFATAPHAAEYFRFYLTREGFDPLTDRLRWDDLELVHDSGLVPYTDLAAEPHFPFQMELPGRDGRYILYVVWQRSDSPEAFYSCTDVVVGANGSTAVETEPYFSPEPAPETSNDPAVPAPGLDDLEVSVNLTDDWGSGACGEGLVVNYSNNPVAWEAHVELDGNVTTFWDSEMSMSTHVHGDDSGMSQRWRVIGTSWNSVLAPGASTSFGFCIDRSAYSDSMTHEMPVSDPVEDESTTEESETVDSNPTQEETVPAVVDDTTSETVPAVSDEVTPETTPVPEAVATDGGPILAAYYPEWGIYGRNYQIADVPAAELTHLIYAFANLDSNGNVILFDPYAAVEKRFSANESVAGVADGTEASGASNRTIWGNFGQIALLKERYPHLRVSIAVGGWTLSAHFSSVLATEEGREHASTSLVEFLERYDMFDGVDFDWEYPGGGGLGGNTASAQDGTNYALFLSRVREKLDVLSNTTGHRYQISVASPAGFGQIQNFNLEELHGLIDFFNVMTYDLHGTWESVTGHLAAMENDPVGYDISTAVRLYLEAGVPREKIVLGFPLYTRAWKGVAAGDDGGYAASAAGAAAGSFLDQNGMYDYKDLLGRLRAAGSTWQLYWDDDAQAAYLYDSGQSIFSSFETPGTVALKSEWAQSMGLGGMMFWDLSSDITGDPESLVTAAAQSWYKGLTFDQIVSGSSLEFDYILGGNGRFDAIAEADTVAVDLGDPVGESEEESTPEPSDTNDETAPNPQPEEETVPSTTEETETLTEDPDTVETDSEPSVPSVGEETASSSELLIEVGGDRWWQGFTAELTVHNQSAVALESWSFGFRSSHSISGAPWGIEISSTDLGNGLIEYQVTGSQWASSIPAGGSVIVGFSGTQGTEIGNEGPLDAELLFDGGIVND